jgi:hypothetical protein
VSRASEQGECHGKALCPEEEFAENSGKSSRRLSFRVGRNSGPCVEFRITRLEAGDILPADCRLVEAFSVRVNNATITGESVPASRDAEPRNSTARWCNSVST